MLDPRNISWTHFNKARRFPLVFGCVPVSTDGQFTIPDDLIVALYLSCNIRDGGYNDPGLFHIGSFVYFGTGFSLAVHYNGEKVAETTVDFSTGTMPEVVQLLSVGSPLVLSGMLVLGGTDGLSQQLEGAWEFSPEASQIDPFCIRYVTRGLSALYVRSRGQLLGPFHGTVTFSEGDNIELGVQSKGELNCLEEPGRIGHGTEIQITALAEEREPPCIRTINSVRPDRNGNISFVGQNCLKITPEGQHTLVFNDTCAEPCCTCAELAPVEEKIKEITSAITQLSSRMETLHTQHEFLLHSLRSAS